MGQETAARFDDVLLDAVTVILAMATRNVGWDAAEADEKGRAIELARGLAGEARRARQRGDEALSAILETLKESASAQLRMLEGLTVPGDEALAGRLRADVDVYRQALQREDASAPSAK